MNRILNGYCRLLDALTALSLAIMVVLVFGNVVLRYVFNSGLMMSEEMSRWFFVWMIFLGAVAALQENGHLGTDFLIARLPLIGKRICAAIAQTSMLYVSWLLVSGSWDQVKINADVTAPVTGASMGIFYASGVVFAASACVILAVQLWRTLSGRATEEDLVMFTESEDLAKLREQEKHAAADAAAASPVLER
ncbi:TRAP transporter small permease [Pelomonas sp. KK5]|uniref:TRAP transporter small permease n=1 Tax=Pelomonas sp. KK5 TaxID=1855730 RepID=UPI0009F9336F|nr:TRAP transporter small permease [Pelomonas sp. KK5]